MITVTIAGVSPNWTCVYPDLGVEHLDAAVRAALVAAGNPARCKGWVWDGPATDPHDAPGRFRVERGMVLWMKRLKRLGGQP